MNKNNSVGESLFHSLKKPLLIMRIAIIFLLVGFLQTHANDAYSQKTKLSISFSNTELVKILDKIENQSEFYFLYNEKLIDATRKVSIDAKDKQIEEVLKNLFSGTDVEYSIIDRKIILAPAYLSGSQQAEKKLKGKVTDQSGAPIPGASIVLKGTTRGVTSDTDGNFSLSVPADAKTLVFSFIGMKLQEIAVGNTAVINVVMQEETVGIEEVVAIGYGVVKKRDLTGSVGSVSSKSYEAQPVTNVSSALQGRAAGVAISNVSGAPGGSIRVRIRGANSINGGNDPLFVLDGMQLSSFSWNDINPSDIENIEILKDASATAIYGSRGANGVVMITTKQGKSETTRVNFTANYGLSERANKYNLLSPVAFANQVNLLNPNTFSASDITKFQNGFGTDWQDEVFQTGKTQDYQMSVSGGTPKTSYFISGRYFDQTGIVINSNYKKYSFHSNIDTKIGNKASLSAGVFLNRSQGFNNEVVGSLRGGVEQTILWGPTTPVYMQNADGTNSNVYMYGDANGAAGKNPVANLRNSYKKNIGNSALLNTKFTYKIFDFLTLDIVGGVDANLNESDNIIDTYADYSSDASVGSNRRHNTSTSVLNSNILTFHKVFGSAHDLTVTGVNEQSINTYDYSYLDGQGSPFSINHLIGYYAIGQNPTKSLSAGYSQSQLRSYIGRINYAFNGKYLLTGSYRADGSSKFPNNKWGYFPSFSAGWKVTEESFVHDLNLFSNLKLRGGWGVTGNHGVDPFLTIPTMASGNFSYGLNTDYTFYSVSNSGAAPNLKWEQTAQTDIGVDMSFFKNRLSLSADYFIKKTKDLLFSIPTPAYWGGGSVLSNVGDIENKGFELVLSGVPVDTKDFTWTSNFNFSTYKNKVVALGGGAEFLNSTITNLLGSGIASNDMLRIIVGESIGTFWGVESQGIWQTGETAEAALFGKKPGDYKYLDLNNDKIIDSNDKKVIGHSLPKFTWGFDNNFRYKNLELNVFVTAVYGNKINNFDYSQSCTIGGDTKRITNADVVPWTASNPSNVWPALGTGTSINDLTSSRFLQDGSFIRLKNISLSYLVPTSLTKGTPLKLSVSGQNIITLTKFKGYDPEATSGGNTDYNQGVVSGAYPSPRIVTFSVQLNF